MTERQLEHLRSQALSSSLSTQTQQPPTNPNRRPNMATPPDSTVQTLLRYTYRANMVFFAGYGAWYMLKGPGRGQEQDVASLLHRHEKVSKDTK